MIETLTSELNLIQLSQKAQQMEIDKLYLELNEISERKSNLSKRHQPTRNLFAIVRPEVMYQILEFVDVKSFLKFRLVSKRCNQVIQQISPQKSQQVQAEVKQMENDLEKLIQDQQGINQTELNQQLEESRQALGGLRKSSIVELKSLANPPFAIRQACSMIYFLMNPQADVKQLSWTDVQKMLNQMNFLNQLLQFDISLVTEKQLANCATINDLTMPMIQSCSIAASELFRHAQARIDIRQSKLYTVQYQIDNLKRLLKTKQSLSAYLQGNFKK